MTWMIVLAALLMQAPLGGPTLAGEVQDGAKKPVTGAKVTIWDARTGVGVITRTGAAGYSFNGLGGGEYLLKVEKEGRGLLLAALRVDGDTPRTLDLEMAAGDAGEVKAGHVTRETNSALQAAKKPNVQQAKLIRKVMPVYPGEDRQKRVDGQVSIWVSMRKDGSLDDLVVLSAPSEGLALASLRGVRQWRYTPILVDDKPVEMEFEVMVNFHIGVALSSSLVGSLNPSKAAVVRPLALIPSIRTPRYRKWSLQPSARAALEICVRCGE